MPTQKCRSKIFHLLLLFLITGGYVYQSRLICIDYFSYTTTTHVSILSYTTNITIPSVRFCFYHTYNWYHHNLSEIFERLEENNIRLTAAGYTAGDCGTWNGYTTTSTARNPSTIMKFDKFFHGNNPCFLFRWTRRISVPAINEISRCPSLAITQIIFSIRTDKSLEPDVGINRFLHLEGLVIPFDSDLDSLIRTPIKHNIDIATKLAILRYSYSSNQIILASAPYDTDCVDYSTSRFTSQQNCINQCVKEVTETHGFLHDRTIIQQDRYGNSSLKFIPFPVNFERKSESQIREYVNDSDFSIPAKYFNDTVDKIKVAGKAELLCRDMCKKPDCRSEMLSPSLIGFVQQYFNESLVNDYWRYQNESHQIDVRLFPPNKPTVIVESKAKLSLLDLIVYTSSCLSFWYGFCPLKISELIRQKHSKKTRKAAETSNIGLRVSDMDRRHLVRTIQDVKKIYNVLKVMTLTVTQHATEIKRIRDRAF